MDWRRFLEENNIHFVDRGPNTKRGEISIQCPMCGDEDPSEHLGINLKTWKWGCHRDASHRGKAPRTLIKAILGCSSNQAHLIVKQYSHSDPDTLEAALAVLEADENNVTHHDEDVTKQARHQMLGPQLDDFYHIKPRGITKRFFNYLMERGYENPQDIIDRYELRCAMTGKYKDRIIIPIRLNNELLGWTSRALGRPVNAPRYLASSEDVKTTVLNYDELKEGGDRLFIVEGPFDAIKVDSHLFTQLNRYNDPNYKAIEFRATCTFGTSVTMSQLVLLRNLVKKFTQTWILFDRGADKPASDLADWTGANIAFLPDHIEDPGDLKPRQLDQLGELTFNGWFNIPSGLQALIYDRDGEERKLKARAINRNQGKVSRPSMWRKP
jgi:hypothetical protein